MLGQSGYSRTMLPNVREIETRLRSLEQQLERVFAAPFRDFWKD